MLISKITPSWVPLLSTHVGSCMTLQNLQQVGVNIVAYDLIELLLKPGLDVLMQLPSLKSYIGNPAVVILNASKLIQSKPGIYRIHSHYDGSYIEYSADILWQLLCKLQASILLLPPGGSFDLATLPKHTKILVAYADMQYYSADGIYIVDQCIDENFLSLINQHKTQYYICSQLDRQLMLQCITHGAWVESDLPMLDAYNGLVYTYTDVIDIKSEENLLQIKPIDNLCKCPTCVNGLTRAYLHHLYMHTPLLCQRLLMQHNAYMIFNFVLLH